MPGRLTARSPQPRYALLHEYQPAGMPDGDKGSRLSADDAFATLGNETRVQILRELGDAGEPLAFSTLYDRVDVTDSSQYNYHLDRLLGYFVHRVDGEYALARPGERIVEAIRSGAVTGDPELERTTRSETGSVVIH